ncbi:MAG: hypothetical protein L3J00_05655 [Thiomicrorhabdus sp.]|nr:hypothetical protein [Thiomicrorhabdus sp.]
MTYPIKQLKATYNSVEDRILLTVEVQQKQMYSGWLTRRFLTILLPVLHGQHPVTGELLFDNKPPENRGPKIYQSKPVLKKEDTSHNPSYPLGESPLLFSKITFTALKTEDAMFILLPNSNKGIKLPFTPALLNLLLTTIKEPLEQSNWALEVNGIYGVPSNNRLQ